MIYVPQVQLSRLKSLVAPGKAVVIYGPRRTGKTTLVSRFVNEIAPDALVVSGEDIVVREYLKSQSIAKLKSFVGNHQIIVIDEAQYVREIGLNLKLLVDHIDGISVVATGSSSFDLRQVSGEPLTGRKHTLLLLPLVQSEIQALEAPHETSANLESRLIYGSYPEVVLMNSNEERGLYLKELINSYLLKDIFQLSTVRFTDKLLRLLQLIAFQIGQQVSLTELGGQLGMSKNSVETYLDLLENSFVLFSRGGFSRNLRKEITKSRRYYFYDNGIRNALISNFNVLSLREDAGALWENYVITERLKRNLYSRHLAESYFWRTYDRQEIDLIEVKDGQITATECKWSQRKSHRVPTAWAKAYPDSTFHVIHPGNYLDFIRIEN